MMCILQRFLQAFVISLYGSITCKFGYDYDYL